MSWEDGGPLEPPEVHEVECPRCGGDGIDPDDRDELCSTCNGDGYITAAEAAELEDREEGPA